MTFARNISLLAFSAATGLAQATGTEKGGPPESPSVGYPTMNNISVNGANAKADASATSTGGHGGDNRVSALSGNTASVSGGQSTPPKIIEIKKDMGSCLGSPWQVIFQEVSANAILHVPYGLRDIGTQSISIGLDQKIKQDEMQYIAEYLQRKLHAVPKVTPKEDDSSTGVGGVSGGNTNTNNTTVNNTVNIYTPPRELKVVTFTCSGFEMK